MPDTSSNGSTPDLISPEYRTQQEKLHAGGQYGVVAGMYAPMVSEMVNRMGITRLLDYGCGSQCHLLRNLKVNHKLTYQAYDPAVEQFSKPPVPAEVVACIDVLEHIEPELLENVLDDLKRLAEQFVFLTIDTEPALKVLEDGRNAHLIQEPLRWWLPKLWSRWELQTVQMISPRNFMVIGLAEGFIENLEGGRIA